MKWNMSHWVWHSCIFGMGYKYHQLNVIKTAAVHRYWPFNKWGKKWHASALFYALPNCIPVIQGHDICNINPITCGHIQKHLQNVIKIVEIWSTLLFQNNISYQSDFNDFQWSEMWLFTKTFTKCHNSCYSAILSFPPKMFSHASALLWSQTTFQIQTTSQDWLFQKSYFAIIYIDII